MTADEAAGRFEDEVAGRTEWSALVPGGTRFRTRWMVVSGSDRVELRTMPLQAVLLTLVTLGLSALDGLLLTLWSEATTRERLAIVALTVTVGLLVPVTVSALRPVRFDRATQFFTRPWAPLTQARACVPLDEIHAFQLLRERCRTRHNTTFDSHELNAVLRDGRRFNVTDHGNLGRLRVDAYRLSRFLGVPLWDASDVEAEPTDSLWSS